MFHVICDSTILTPERSGSYCNCSLTISWNSIRHWNFRQKRSRTSVVKLTDTERTPFFINLCFIFLNYFLLLQNYLICVHRWWNLSWNNCWVICTSHPSFAMVLTDEQKKRIEENRRRALLKREQISKARATASPYQKYIQHLFYI